MKRKIQNGSDDSDSLNQGGNNTSRRISPLAQEDSIQRLDNNTPEKSPNALLASIQNNIRNSMCVSKNQFNNLRLADSVGTP